MACISIDSVYCLVTFLIILLTMSEFQPATTQQFFTARNKSKLWNESQITVAKQAPHLSFAKEQRFKWASIYWPSDNPQHNQLLKKRQSESDQIASKISKAIDDQEKNQERLRKLKRSFSIGKSQRSQSKKESHTVQSTRKPFKLSKLNQDLLDRLATQPNNKQSLLRDRHGNRSNRMSHDDPESYDGLSPPRFMGDSTGFKTSQRVQLELPHNFFPGPGTYQVKRYLGDLQDQYLHKKRSVASARLEDE